MSTSLTDLLFGILGAAPGLLVILGGIVLCLLQMRSYPRTSQLALVALALMLADQLFGLVFYRFVLPRSPGLFSTPFLLGGVGLAQSLGHALGLGLLLAALYAERSLDVATLTRRPQ